MPHFSTFPEGEDLWLVRWMDEFHLAQGRSTAASIRVLLQRLDLPREKLIRLKSDEVAELLASPPQTTLTYAQIGYLAALAVGQIYQSGKFLCELPCSQLQVDLPDAEASGEAAEIRGRVKAPAWWTASFPSPMVSNPEFPGLPWAFEKSQCIAFEMGERTVVLPRVVIFRAFYGPHSILARAFTSGPYSNAMERLVYFEPLSNGLQTCIDKEANEWHVILQPKVKDPYARLVAVHLFDPFARHCAEFLYSDALRQRGGAALRSWYANAKLPFRGPLTLVVKGHDLIAPKPTSGRKRRFLVTAIIGTSVPDYLPVIKFERRNSGVSSPNPKNSDKPPPYGGGSQPEPVPIDLALGSDDDGDEEAPAFDQEVVSFHWLAAQPPEKIKKQSSERHTSVRPISTRRANNGKGSGGEEQGGELGTSAVNSGADAREPITRFASMMRVFERLRRDRWIDDFVVVQPGEKRKMEAGGVACWNFLDEEIRKQVRLHPRTWAMMPSTASPDERPTRPVPRAAMLVELVTASSVLLWTEIETRANEGFRSPVIVADQPLQADEMEALLSAIAEAQGRGLRTKLVPFAARVGARVLAYKHKFEGAESGRAPISYTSVVRFLQHEIGLPAPPPKPLADPEKENA